MYEMGTIAALIRGVLGYLKNRDKQKFDWLKFAPTVVVYTLAWILVYNGFSSYDLDQTQQLLIAVGFGELAKEAVTIIAKMIMKK
jgi:hypothetical protein